MGLFSNKTICEVCQEECDFPKFKLYDGGWLCQDCLKDSGLSSSEAAKMNASAVKLKIREKILTFPKRGVCIVMQ